MGPGTEIDQTKIVDLDRGIFLIQYQAADDSLEPPRVQVAMATGSEGKVDFLLHPDAVEPILWQPKSALVVRIASSARIVVRVEPSRPGGSRAAIVRIEPIEPGLRRSEPGIGQRSGDPLNLDDLRVLGHVAGIGDVMAGRNAWIAGPAAPSRIEGFALQWPSKPPNIDIGYAAKIAGSQDATPNVIPIGAFAGTRGRALPVVGLIMEMAGRNDLQLAVEALFLNSPILKASGRRIAVSGPTGREPMIGLRVNLEVVSATEAKPLKASSPSSNVEQPQTTAPPQHARKAGTSGRVRVFRSRSRQDASLK